MKMTVVCCKTVEPVHYNKGASYETTHDEFLAYYTYKTIEEAEKEVEEMNANHPAVDACGNPINWAEIAYFFVDEQEEMY